MDFGGFRGRFRSISVFIKSTSKWISRSILVDFEVELVYFEVALGYSARMGGFHGRFGSISRRFRSISRSVMNTEIDISRSISVDFAVEFGGF